MTISQALADGAAWGLGPTSAPRTGTYIGCMFTDYMALVRTGHGRAHSGALMTGAVFGVKAVAGADLCISVCSGH